MLDAAQLQSVYNDICVKAKRNTTQIKDSLYEYPGTETGCYFCADKSTLKELPHIFCWTQSFFTGMALLAAKETSDADLFDWVVQFYPAYHNKVFVTPQDTMHDLGFLYTLYSTLDYKMTQNKAMRSLSLQAAQVLSHRFVPNGRYIRAWGRMDDTLPTYVDDILKKNNFFSNSQGLAIIDCMMNLPLLFWASQETNDPFYRNIAIAHADTTLAHFIREDGSVCHAFRFDPQTGTPIGEFNDCGYAIGSHWARGSAWAAYGFALAYRYTKLQRYYDAAVKIATAYLNACGETLIPVWDFRLPAHTPARYGGYERPWTRWDITSTENCCYNVDSSAACIMNCALLELLQVAQNHTFSYYVSHSTTVLLTEYLNLDPSIDGILKRINGTDGYAAFGDYFLMELVARLLKKDVIPW